MGDQPAMQKQDLHRVARSAAGAALIGALVAVAFFSAFCVLNYASLDRNLPAARQAIRDAFTAGTLQDIDWLPGNTDIGRHQFNDCLILEMSIDQRGTPAQMMVSPLQWPFHNSNSLGMCRDLRQMVDGQPLDPRLQYYHRYIHGQTMLARYLLPHLSIAAIRKLYFALITIVVTAGLAAATVGLSRGGARCVQHLFWLIAFLAFARWFGLESYGQSLGHAPSDFVLLGYMLFLTLASLRGGLGRRAAIASAALFGAATMSFEFLTGGIPLGLALIVGGLPFAVRSDVEADIQACVIDALAGFCAAVTTCILVKILLAIWVFGLESLWDSLHYLGVRLGVPGAGAEDLGPIRFAKAIVKGLDSLGAGMLLMNALMIALSIAAGAWGATRIYKGGDHEARTRASLLLLSNVVILLWIAVFREHMIVHAWFMDRMFTWTIASGFGLFALALQMRARPQAA
jgi:hypothetical protein